MEQFAQSCGFCWYY